VKLKLYHSDDQDKLRNLEQQQGLLVIEIDEFIADAINGLIPLSKLTFRSNKVFKQDENVVRDIKGSIGVVVSKLAEINCLLWHEQEKVYDFKNVPPEEKNQVVKQLAILNLERTKCIDVIDNSFAGLIHQ
jgi:hypothetical protein